MNRFSLSSALAVAALWCACGAPQGSEPSDAAPTSAPFDAGTNLSRFDAGIADAGVVETGPKKITVTGTVITSRGQLVGSVTVIVLGVGSTTTTNGFTIPNVTVPYDIAVLSGVNSTVTIYKNLRRADPRLVLADESETSSKGQATINVSMAGSLLSSPAWYSFDASAADKFRYLRFNKWLSSTSAELAYQWWTDQTVGLSAPSLCVLSYLKDSNGYPVDYRFGTKELNVLNNSTISAQVMMGSVETETLNAQVMLPSGGKLSDLSVYVAQSNGCENFVNSQATATQLALKVPKMQGSSLVLYAEAFDNAQNVLRVKAKVASANTPVTLRMAPAPRLSLPIDNAQGIDLGLQSFSWDENSPVSIASFSLGAITLHVVGDGSSVHLPSTSELGLGSIPSNTRGTWYVRNVENAKSVDDLVDPSHGREQEVDELFSYASHSVDRKFTVR